MMRAKAQALHLVAVILFVFAISVPTFGQMVKGSLSGTATDPQGSVLSHAAVRATNADTGASFTTTTDSSGSFRFNLLPVGPYKLEIRADGMKTAVLLNKMVVAGEDRGVGNVRMIAGASSEIEEVPSSNLVNPAQAQVTNTFTGTTLQTFAGIQEGEGLDRLAIFVPGLTEDRAVNFANTNGVGFTSNGQRGRSNDQQIDGQSNNDSSVSGPALFVSDPEFVQQYVLVTNQFGPEYARNSGSVINVITKSGTDSWHGSVYGSETNSYLDALTNTQKTSQHLSGPPRSNQEFSGVTVGGPLIRNKLLIFGGFDDSYTSTSQVDSSTALTPTPAGLSELSSCPGLTSNSLNVLTEFGPYAFPAGNPAPLGTPVSLTFGSCTFQAAGVTRTVPTPSHVLEALARADYQLGNNTFAGRYMISPDDFYNGNDNGAGGWVDNTITLSQAALISWTRNLNPSMVNEARFSFLRSNADFGGNTIGNPLEPDAAHIGQALANITISGFLGIGPGDTLPQSRLLNIWQPADNWTYQLGKHTLKAGVNFTFQRSPNTILPDFNGRYQFSSVTNFLNNVPSSVSLALGQTSFDFHENDAFLYGGDDWKIRQNLTLNLGLAWSYYGNPSSLFNQITTQRENSPTTSFWGPTLPLSVRTVPALPTAHTNFGPGIGFAYSPQWGGFLTGHGKTVFRGGYRLLYDPPFYNIFINEHNSAPTTFLQTLRGTAAATNPLPAVPTGPNVRAALTPSLSLGTSDPRTFDQTTLSNNFGPDKVNSWVFGFQREINKDSAIEARYVGNHAYDLYQALDGNPFIGALQAQFPTLVPSGLTPCPTSNAFNSVAAGRVNCNEGLERTYTNNGFSNYNALQLEFRASNLFRQLTLRTGYTWSKTLDNVSEIFSTNAAGNTLAFAQNPSNPGGPEYSLSGLNFPQQWTFSFVEQLPFLKNQQGWMGKALGGWSVSGNYIYASGQPYTPLQDGEAEFTSSGNFYDSAFLGAFVGTDTARPFIGSLKAPANQVGVFPADVCEPFFGIVPGNSPTFPGACNTSITPTNQLLSFNSLNQGGFLAGPGTTPGQTPVAATSDSVRLIVNGGASQAVFGTPFGNVTRNSLTDASTNIFNLSIFKEFSFGQRIKFEIHATALNLFNHYNFSNVDPFVEDAGLSRFGTGFANPSLSPASGRILWVGGKLRF